MSVASTGSKLVASGATGPLFEANKLLGTSVGKKISKKTVAIILWCFLYLVIINS
jgi:hypothetical protein